MQIHNPHTSSEVEGLQANKFGFEMNAKMYDILISKMYTNKPGAIIRELASNAWDGHVAAGNTDVPFDIQLPTWLDKSFAIRDYGTGIPHDRFEHIYTNVGASTKEGSNEFIGGFGLGSKTPFTLTDTFTVENFHEGIKTTWVCFKDKGEPNVSKVSEEPTSEPSGLRVSFTFDEGDVNSFKQQIVKQLRFFPVKPIIISDTDITFGTLPEGWEDGSRDYFFNLTSKSAYHVESYVVMGNVGYLLSPGEFNPKFYEVFRKGLIMRAPIGAVDVPPSREHLEMTPRTKKYIEEQLEKIVLTYETDVQEGVNKCTTEWQLRLYLYTVHTKLINLKNITWRGDSLDSLKDLFQLYIENIGIYPSYSVEAGRKQLYRKLHISIGKAAEGVLSFYIDDVRTGASQLLKAAEDKFNSNMIIFKVPELTKKTKDVLVAKAIKSIQDETGITPQLLSSIIGFPVVATKDKKTTQAKPNQVYLVSSKLRTSTLLQILTAQSDLPKDGYYVELNGWQLVQTVPNLTESIQWGLDVILDKPLYAIRSASIKDLPSSMKLLDANVLNKLKPKIEKEHLVNLKQTNILCTIHRIPKEHKLLIEWIPNKKAKVYARYCTFVTTKAKVSNNVNYPRVYSMLYKENLPINIEFPAKLLQLQKEYEEFHELFQSITASYSTERNTKRVNTFLNIMLSNQT